MAPVSMSVNVLAGVSSTADRQLPEALVKLSKTFPVYSSRLLIVISTWEPPLIIVTPLMPMALPPTVAEKSVVSGAGATSDKRMSEFRTAVGL